MTCKELIKKLRNLPNNLEVDFYVDGVRGSDPWRTIKDIKFQKCDNDDYILVNLVKNIK
jgi:hypothetical protein